MFFVSSVIIFSNYDYNLVETGQTKVYDVNGNEITSSREELYGQDGDYQKGKKFSFIDNGDGTITDLNTGLIWQKTPPSTGITWEEAYEYCENLELGGYDDWRLPTVKELFSIWNGEEGWPYIDTKYFDLVNVEELSKDEQYWSSTKYVGVTVEGKDNAAFGVNFATGHIKAYPAGSDENKPPINDFKNIENSNVQRPPKSPLLKYVRAVRGNIYGENKFVDNGDGTIIDENTGLMWSKIDFGPMDWKEALKFSEESTYAGYDDWRLPNVKELLSIVDYSRSPTAIDENNIGPAISSIFSSTQIINEAGETDYPYYWTSTSAECYRINQCIMHVCIFWKSS
ncbi:DUF1566 domain-containing protein [Marinitoga sp. 38H-ov]|uniref:Lcl C-terminal domain-containing protein n=1 Tax=Marinitoga sp. 38H-ov TaxID=1755814 RepID=UPI0013ED221C|nr:DUF1566 domain-containing protein [Marinitoga sp. 38H-ov]KAF2956245.1 hypothetical protein AS160_00165 [Marinitoga sp. 38H-ov]